LAEDETMEGAEAGSKRVGEAAEEDTGSAEGHEPRGRQRVPPSYVWDPLPPLKIRGARGSSYIHVGSGLTLSGLILAVASYLLLASIPLTALGVSMTILGSVLLALSRGLPTLSPQATSALMESGLRNVSAILEELGLSSKAVYLSSSRTGRDPKALIPLRSNPSLPKPEKPLPERFIVRYGAHPEDLGVLVTTPGSLAVSMLDSKPSPRATDIESALTSLAVMMGLADAAKVSMSAERVTVELSYPRLAREELWAYRLLGSPLASIVASIVAEALGKPVLIEREEHVGAKGIIDLRVVD